MITAGIDCGAKNTKAVILKDGEIIGYRVLGIGFRPKKSFLSLNHLIPNTQYPFLSPPQIRIQVLLYPQFIF